MSILVNDGNAESNDDFLDACILCFDELIHNYVKIVHSSLRKEFRENECVKKTKAHRTNILIGSS